MRYYWQKHNWLTLPNITPDIENVLDKINSLRRKIFDLSTHDWFKIVQQEVYKTEIFYSWEIENAKMYTVSDDLHNKCHDFARSSDVLTPDTIIAFHDTVFPRMVKGIRTCAVGVGSSNENIVYVAPPAESVSGLLDDLCRLVVDESVDMHIKAAFAHIAFVIIHPFQDGNGRVARMIASRIVSDILVDVSRFIYLKREFYYENLRNVIESNGLEKIIVYILFRYYEAYYEIYRDLYNFNTYLDTYGGEFTTLSRMRTDIIFDEFEYVNRYL